MWKILGILQKNLTWSIPVFMILGLAFGNFSTVDFLKSWIIPLTFLMVYPMMVTLNIKELLTKGDARLQIAAQLINFAVIPFLGLGIGRLFFPDNHLVVLGLLLTSLLPTSGMTISWTGFAKGNVPAAVKMTVIGLLAGSVLTPIYLKLLMGTVVNISLLEVFRQIIFIVFLPLIVGYATQLLLIKRFGKEEYEKKQKPKFPMFSTLGVLGIVFVSMALKAKAITSNPIILLYFLLPIVLIYAINFVFSTIIGKLLFKDKDAISLVYGTVMRNLSIALAIAMGVFGEKGSEIALIISMAYIIQVQAAAWYVKLTGKIFKEATLSPTT
ncbi:MAG: arsenite transporter [Clostridiales bacterium]|nr:arsenite transporter [Clostridiales bacterium]MDK2932940.1 arsenite transporter [Clostridiales bacterium]